MIIGKIENCIAWNSELEVEKLQRLEILKEAKIWKARERIDKAKNQCHQIKEYIEISMFKDKINC